MSQDFNLNTPRGIHKGSNLHQIPDKYGTNYISIRLQKPKLTKNQVSESADSVTLSYLLTAVDNPGGNNEYNGQVIIIKESDGWKIDKVTNKNIKECALTS